MELEERLHYEERMEILFLKDNSTGAYEPLLYDCKIIDGEYEGKRILPNSIFHDLIKFVRRLSENIDKNTGQKARGYFEIYQENVGKIKIELKWDIIKYIENNKYNKNKRNRQWSKY